MRGCIRRDEHGPAGAEPEIAVAGDGARPEAGGAERAQDVGGPVQGQPVHLLASPPAPADTTEADDASGEVAPALVGLDEHRPVASLREALPYAAGMTYCGPTPLAAASGVIHTRH